MVGATGGVGHLAVHTGHQLHQIAPTKDVQASDRRMTMQAHALPVDGRWLIDDFIHGGDWQFTTRGSVKEILLGVAALCPASQ